MTTKLSPKRRGFRLTSVAAMVLAGVVSACAAAPEQDPEAAAEYRQANDPAEPTNRTVFELNRGLDSVVFKPAAQAYRTLPDVIRTGVNNFLTNWTEPLILVHDVLQGEFDRAGTTFTRFVTNTTFGFLGVGDVASAGMGLHHHDEDMGQTLAVWGVEEGPYVMLPLLGPSNARDTVGKVVDFFIDPVGFVVSMPTSATASKFGVDGVDKRERHLEVLADIERTSLDYYASIRTLYRQRRAEEVVNGRKAVGIIDTGISYEIERPKGPDLSQN